jgi:ADP-ribose pyrophosphatase
MALIPPDIRLELVEDLSPPDPGGFLRLVRRRFRAHYPDGTSSEAFVYDEVDRPAIDAVVIAAHYATGGRRHVYLRSAVRPPVVMRDARRSPIPEPARRGMWELPAGLIEAGEQDRDGPRRAAARELFEELGFGVEASALLPLGPSSFPAPGVIAERHFFFHVEVAPQTRVEPAHDGSPLEHLGAVVSIPLDDALAMCRRAEIEDAKTELALRRLAEIVRP